MNSGPTGSWMVSARIRSIRAMASSSRRQPKASAMPFNCSGLRAPPQRHRRAAIENPADGQGQHRLAIALASQFFQLRDRCQVLGEAGLLELRVGLAQVVAVEAGLGVHPSGKQAAAQRTVGQYDDAVALGVGQHVGVDGAFEQVVGRLHAGQRGELAEAVHLFRRIVAHADGEYLAVAAQALQFAGGFLVRHQRVRPVDLVQVDAIGFQPSQRVLDLPADACGGGVAVDAGIAPLQRRLGGDHRLVAQTLQGLADDLLGVAEAIDRRSVDQVDPGFHRAPDGFHRRRVVSAAPHPAADGPGAEADARDRRVDALDANAFNAHGNTPRENGCRRCARRHGAITLDHPRLNVAQCRIDLRELPGALECRLSPVPNSPT